MELESPRVFEEVVVFFCSDSGCLREPWNLCPRGCCYTWFVFLLLSGCYLGWFLLVLVASVNL